MQDESNMLRWTAYLRGPRDTPFEEHYFQLRISVPSKYPLEPPKIVFVTKIFHPNIHYKVSEPSSSVAVEGFDTGSTLVRSWRGCYT